MKLSLKSKILVWFGVIILISFILYGFLIFFVYSYNLRGERYIIALSEHPGLDQLFIERLKELNKSGPFGLPPQLTILPPGLFMRIFFNITVGVLVIIIISASGGFLVLRRMLKQVYFITRNVKEIDDKRLHLRLNLRGKDAISNMAKTFDNMLDKIEVSFKKQKQFIQNASHELNTPLTIIKTKIDVLKQKKSITKKECMETIELVDSEIMRLSKITEELLTLSELEENVNKANLSQINIKRILEKMLKLFKNQISSKNLKLETSFNGDFEILGSKIQIEQVLFNLIDNAVKYSTPKKEIEISLSNDKDNKMLILDITNISEIIKEEDLPYIFDRFYKTSAITDKKGFGLGLSISKKIVENHNGSIKVDYNKDKKEITFKVYLPLFIEK
ncbi:MAG: HAMP domain-containing histidine kinase [Actinobacteria bacterium]|nr:HAMP domain-containing histidine kinase [Actinomycetota bacterium]